MSLLAHRADHSSGSFSSRQNRRSPVSSAMTNDRSRVPAQINHFLPPLPSIGESLPKRPASPKSLSFPPGEVRTRCRSNTKSNESSSTASPKQTYTFSNPPRQLESNLKLPHSNRLRHRVSSAPLESSTQSSPRSLLYQQKSSSANETTSPRAHQPSRQRPTPPPRSVRDHSSQDKEKEKSSLDALMKHEKKSNVPKAVTQRRIILLFHRSSTSEDKHASPTPPPFVQSKPALQPSKIPVNPPAPPPSPPPVEKPRAQPHNSQSFNQRSISSMNNMEPEMADSMQLAAILEEIQGDWNPSDNVFLSPQTKLDPEKYNYVVPNLGETATYRLSPRTLKPNEELQARTRYSQYYRHEMRSSANARIPPLMASIVTENNPTLGMNTTLEKTFTFRLSPNGTIKSENDLDSMEATSDGEQIQLCYDATLNGFYDPNTGLYYELTSA